MTNEERKAVEEVRKGIRRYLDYIYNNSNIKFTEEMKREVEGKQQTIEYNTLYEAYLTKCDELRQSNYIKYQLKNYLANELVYTKDGLMFLRYTKVGKDIDNIIEEKREYKVKRKWWWTNWRYHKGD